MRTRAFWIFSLLLASQCGRSLQAEQLHISSFVGGAIVAQADEITTHSIGAIVPIQASALAGYAFTGWTGSGSENVADVAASSTTITMNTDARVYAAFSPLPAVKIRNGEFTFALDEWTTWTINGSVTPQIIGTANELRIAGSGFSGGLYQQFDTGGAGNVITVSGRWESLATTATSMWAEVWAINADRAPADGIAESDGVNSAVLIFRSTDPAGWNGAIARTATDHYQISFVAGDDRATLMLVTGNDGSGPTDVRFDSIEVRAVGPPGTLLAAPPGFAFRTLTMPDISYSRIAEHPITHDIYAVRAFGDRELHRIDPSANPLAVELVAEITNLGLDFDSWSSGLTFDLQGNIYVISHNGDLIKGAWNSSLDSYSWSMLLDINDTLGLSPVGDHGFGELTLDAAAGVFYINYGAVRRGRGNTEPEPDNGYNTRILQLSIDGTGLVPYCRGIRHDFGLTLRSDRALFGVCNSNDCHSAEDVHFLEPGKHYGYPYNFGTDRGPNDAGLFTCEETPALNGPFSPRQANYGPDGRTEIGMPGYIDGGVYWGLHPHSSPNGIAFYETHKMDPAAPKFPAEYHGRAFVARFGGEVATSPDVGYDLLSLRMDDATAGFICNEFVAPIGRAVHVLCHYNGRVYVLLYSLETSGAASAGSPSVIYEISTTATAVTAPDIAATPGPVNFGIQANGNPPGVPVAIEIENEGNEALFFASGGIEITGANTSDFIFATPASLAPLNPLSSRQVQISFAPTALGARSAELRITTNDPDEPTVIIALTGLSVPETKVREWEKYR